MRIFLTITLSICTLLSFAQKGREQRIPLQSNPVLQQAAADNAGTHPNTSSKANAFGKAPLNDVSFPFVDWFDQGTTELEDSLWALYLVKIEQATAVLNAQDSSGITYAPADGSVGDADIMRSNNINIQLSNGQLFISFTYSTGSTWKPTDILNLQFKTQSGVFATVWTDGNIVADKRTVKIPIDLSQYASDTFAFQFICKTDRSNTNTSTFLMHMVNVSDQLVLPWYENFAVPSASNGLYPSPANWQRAQPHLYNDGSIYGTQNCVFNAYTKQGNLYSNNGYGDTLISQPIDMAAQNSSDSIFLRFLYRDYPAASATDTLFLELLDSGSQWVRVWNVSAQQATSTYATFIRQINLPAFRHSNFQFRVINKCDYSTTDTLQFGVTGFHMGAKIRLPLIDDFSNVQLFPSSSMWKDKQVYINNDFALAPPSINVATFDGLDEKGNAYGLGDGYLDSLTTLPLNLNGLTKADSVYLSFYVQAQGLGEIPNAGDSLVLEFRNNRFDPGSWHTVWSGTSTVYSTTTFTKITKFIDSVYLTDDFQFRFKNIGSRTGNINNWHIDYIIMDKGRSRKDGYFDFSLSSNPPSLLKKYSSMPVKHYQLNPSAFTNSQQQILISNNDTITKPMNFIRTIYNPEGIRLDSVPNTNPGVLAESRSNVAITNSLISSLNTSTTGDSIIFKAKYYTNSNNSFDKIQTNDTLTIPTIMSNYFAYDDGTAEGGYGVAYQPGSVALGYVLGVADSLYGISMFFNQGKADVSTQTFNIMVWSAIGINGDGTGETVLKRIYQARPTYKDKRNGFYFLKFDEPMYMPKGRFYIGWEQSNIFNLNMGLDMNYLVNSAPARNPEMWYKMYGIWAKTEIEGALMMRPIVGQWIDPPVGIIEENPRFMFNAVMYPNPAKDRVYIETDSENDLRIELFDISGKMMTSNEDHQKSLPLNHVANGVYFVRIQDLVTGNTIVKKLLINQ